MALVSDLSDLSDLFDKLGRHCIPRGFAGRGVGRGRLMCRWGMRAFFMATVVCVLRRRGACMRSVGTVRFMRGVWGRLGIPRGLACRCVVWLGQNVPQGYAGLFLWQRWCAGCGGVALVSDLSDLSDKLGRHCIPRGGLLAAVWFGSGQIYR